MNKAKALFSGAMVLVIAGASAACWYLNEQGLIGKDSVTQPDSYVEQEDNNYGGGEKQEKPDNDKSEEKETATVADTEGQEISTDEINDFLSVFTKVYFSEKNEYTPASRSTYELIRFAYSHIKRTDSSLIETRREDDEVGYYNRVSAEEINKVLGEYLDVTVPPESVYTENDYAFFRYSDGYFMTPAADGLPFVNVAVCDSIEKSDDTYRVTFAVMGDYDVYARGEAELKETDGRLVLVYYKVGN